MRNLLAAALFFLGAGTALAQVPSEQLAPKLSQLGLHRTEGGWRYEYRGASGGRWGRALTAEESAKVFQYLEALGEGDLAEQLAYLCDQAREKVGLSRDDTAWLSWRGERWVATARGIEAAPRFILGDIKGETMPLIALPPGPEDKKIFGDGPIELTPHLGLGRRGSAALEELNEALRTPLKFDGAPSNKPGDPGPPEMQFGWGSMPEYLPTGRAIGSAHDGLSWAADRAVRQLPEGAGQVLGRIAKTMVVEVPLSGLDSHATHEFGHVHAGRARGLRHITYERADGTISGYAPTYRHEEYERLTPEETLDTEAGGFMATQSTADDRLLEMLSQDSVRASKWGGYIANKGDFSGYMFYAYKLAPRNSLRDNLDTQNYAQRWAEIRGGEDADRVALERRRIERRMMTAAWVNAADLAFLSALPIYTGDYLVLGEEKTRKPMLTLGPMEATLGTGVGVYRNGVFYRFKGITRHIESGVLAAVTAGFGDGKQWSLEADVRNIPLNEHVRARAFAAVWEQREGPVRGKPDFGGAAGGGLKVRINDYVGFEINAGVKTEGGYLGRDFESGGFGEAYLVLFPEKPSGTTKNLGGWPAP